MVKGIIDLINAIVAAFERLLLAVNTTQKFFVFTTIILMTTCLWFVYRISISEEILSEFTTAKIERVDTCYQQSVRLNRRIIAIQYPIPDYLIEQGAVQILSAVVIKEYPTVKQFNALCQGLVAEISKPENDARFFQFNPELKKKRQEFYLNLDKPVPEILKKSDTDTNRK